MNKDIKIIAETVKKDVKTKKILQTKKTRNKLTKQMIVTERLKSVEESERQQEQKKPKQLDVNIDQKASKIPEKSLSPKNPH